MVNGVIGRNPFQLLAGQDLGHFATEGRVERQPAATGVGQQKPAGLQIALQRPPPPPPVQRKSRWPVMYNSGKVAAFGSFKVTSSRLNFTSIVELSRANFSRLCTADGSGSHSPWCINWAKTKSSRLGPGLVVHLRGAEEPAELKRAQEVRDHVGAELAGLVDHDARPRGCSWPSQPHVMSRGEKITPARQPKSIPSKQGGSLKVEPSPFLYVKLPSW